MSDSHPFDVDHYSDIFGQEHSVGLGVGHVYRVSPDGTRVHWNDWWLPADWSRQLCTPERGGLRVLALSASASTLFALTEDGSLWTRLWDFDTSGENDLLTYSYLEESVSSSVRGLPAEPWRRQPVIPEGRATDRITIFQDGEGNGARVLRVEGSLDGALGLFEKRIDEEAWRFVETGHPLRGRSLDERGMEGAGLPEPEARGLILEGSLGRQDSGAELGLTLDGYDLFCSPAEVGLSWAGRPLTVDGEALMVPDTIAVVDDPEAREAALELLGDRAVINLRGEAWAEGLDLEEIPRGDLFHVPRSEKGEQGSLFLLEAGGES